MPLVVRPFEGGVVCDQEDLVVVQQTTGYQPLQLVCQVLCLPAVGRLLSPLKIPSPLFIVHPILLNDGIALPLATGIPHHKER